MKRNLQLVETILSVIQSTETQGLLYNPSRYPYLDLSEEYTKNLVDYHFKIMEDAGLIFITHKHPENEIRLTWQGHDYLEQLRDESQ